MKMKSGEIYHVYNRGNNRQLIFYEEENYYLFLSKVKRYLCPYCDILAYCLMPNHFHFLIHANEKTNQLYHTRNTNFKNFNPPLIDMSFFSKGLQLLLSSYAKSMNRKYTRTGSLFRQNTKSRLTSSEFFLDDYSLQCLIYIHNNPVSAGLARNPEDWEFSSIRDYLGLRINNSICNVDLGRKILNLDRNEIQYLRGVSLPTNVIKKIFK